MRRLFSTLITLAFAAALIYVAVANRHLVTVFLAPTALALDLPVYLLFFAGLICGVVLSALVSARPRLRRFWRQRKAERRAEKAESRLTEMQAQEAPAAAKSLAAIDRAQEVAPAAIAPPRRR